MLIGNSARLNSNPMRLFGGVQGNNDMQLSNFHAGTLRNQSIAFGELASTPRGTQPPYSWIRANKSGDLSTFREVIGTGTVPANLMLNGEILGNLIGTGTISSAPMKGVISLIVDLIGHGEIPNTTSLGILAWCISNMIGDGNVSSLSDLLNPLTMSADVSGEGSISDAYMVGVVQMISELVGEGTISLDLRFPANMTTELDGAGDLTTYLKCLAWCISEIIGHGTLEGSDLRGKSFMGAEITSAGELVTAQTCASAVLSAVASKFNDPGTVGNKINSAASAGDPLGTELPGSYIEGSFGHLLGHSLIAFPMGSIVSDPSNSKTIFATTLEENVNDYWKDTLLLFTSGRLKGQIKKIITYNGSTHQITVRDGFTFIPEGGDGFVMVNK